MYSTGNSALCGGLNGKEIQKSVNMCVHVTDSLCCTPRNENFIKQTVLPLGFPGGSVTKDQPAGQETQETGFDLWVRKIPRGRAW